MAAAWGVRCGWLLTRACYSGGLLPLARTNLEKLKSLVALLDHFLSLSARVCGMRAWSMELYTARKLVLAPPYGRRDGALTISAGGVKGIPCSTLISTTKKPNKKQS